MYGVLVILSHALHKTGEGRRATLRPGKSGHSAPESSPEQTATLLIIY